jgi:hypothetical protein
LAAVTRWFDDPARLDEVDWALAGERYWADTPQDNDRKRRKPAEFLVWKHVPWPALAGIAVMTPAMKRRVEDVLAAHSPGAGTNVLVKRDWYC